jgi:hypothetical protein
VILLTFISFNAAVVHGRRMWGGSGEVRLLERGRKFKEDLDQIENKKFCRGRR